MIVKIYYHDRYYENILIVNTISIVKIEGCFCSLIVQYVLYVNLIITIEVICQYGR